MRTKSKVLLPPAALAALIMLTAAACPPPPPPPLPTGCANVPPSAPGPDSQNPIPGTSGIDGRALATVVIGNRVYVGGTFANALSSTGTATPRANLAAFCLADGKLDTTFVANIGGGAVNALATDGTSLFVGGAFTTHNGAAVSNLIKLNAATGARIAAFAPKPPQAQVIDLHFNGVLYAAGEFGKIGAPPAGNQNYVGNAASFNPTSGAWTGWFAGANSKVESITTSPGGSAVFIGGNFTEVKKPDQATPGTARDRLARLGSAAPGVLAAFDAGVVGGRSYDLAVSADSSSLYAAIGQSGTAMGRRIVNFNATTGAPANWDNNNIKGDGEAVEVIGTTLYAGFLGGYDNPSNPLPLLPANYRILGINPSVGPNNAGHVTAFQPSVTSASPANGVFDLAQGSNRMVAAGDFTQIGTTGNLKGLAIFA